MNKRAMEIKLTELKDKEIALSNPIVHSESGVSHLAGCKGILLQVESGESWEDIIVLGNMTDRYGQTEKIWFNAKDIENIK